MAERFLIDTCSVIKYLSIKYPLKGITFMDIIVDKECNISFISEIELQAWNPPLPSDINIYKEFIEGSRIISIDKEIINKTINVRKNQKLKIPDAIIAATAIVNGLTLITDNIKDFSKVPELKYINPANMA